MTHREMLSWARLNLKNLSVEINEYFARKPFVTDAIINNETNDHAVIVKFNDVATVPNLEFKLGDVVHNMRVSMDYLAHAIAMQHNPTFATTSRKIAFPVCEASSKWASEVSYRQMETWCSPAALDAFERVQPYNTKWGSQHPFIGLTNLDNPHKHRTLIAAAPDLANMSYQSVGRADAYSLIWSGCDPQFEDGCTVARFKYNPLPDGKQHGAVETSVGFSILFDEANAAGNWEVRTYLKMCADHLEFQTFPELEPFTR